MRTIFIPFPSTVRKCAYGAFIQAWATQHGQGRVVAFTDSTIPSNFCVGQPGKSEVMLGMIEWLNHTLPPLDPRPWLLLVGFIPLAAGIWMARGRNESWLLLLAAGTCGWVVASVAVAAAQRSAMPVPECLHPQRCVVIDRTLSDVPLSIGPYTQGAGEGYGLLEQWIARLDSYTVRKEGPEAFSGDVLAIICPSRSVSEEFRRHVAQYVAGGGKLLVIDSPENVNSTANSLLWEFGLSIHHDRSQKGKLIAGAKLPAVDIARACEVAGGQPVARIDSLPVAATVRHGKGSVMAIGFGSLWDDASMGETWSMEPGVTIGIERSWVAHAKAPGWMLEPNATVRTHYDVLFGLLGPFFDGKPLPAAPSLPGDKSQKGKDLGLRESGPAEL